MRLLTKYSIAFAILLFTQQVVMAVPTATQITTVLRQTIENVIRPAYQYFETQTSQLQNRVSNLCTSPSKAAQADARDQFSKTALAWASIELFRSGPVMDQNRLERVLFYPDRKSTGLKQVQRLIVKSDPSIAPDNIAHKSVAVQGLGALEFLLFGTGNELLSAQVNSFRCQYASSVTTNLHTIASELYKAWMGDYSKQWINAGQEGSIFLNEQEAINELLGTIVHGLEALKDIRLKAFLREEPNRDRPKSALFWRSNNTLAILRANLEFIHSLLRDGDLYSLAKDNDRLIEQIEFEFQQNKAAINAVKLSLFEALKNDDLRGKLAYFGTSLKFTINRIDQEFAQDLGLSSGFSFSDGD